MKHSLNYAEFYITNVCNLNCTECNRFNNYHFNGHQLWDDYSNVYAKWGDVIELPYVSILGGEPLLNPSINSWLYGIRKIWNDTVIEVTTNGSRLNYVKGLYQAINDTNAFLHVSVHNQESLDTDVENNIYEFLESPITKETIIPDDIDDSWQQQYNRIKQPGWMDCNSHTNFEDLPAEHKQICIDKGLNVTDFLNFNSYYRYTDANLVKILVYVEDVFYHSAITLNNGVFNLNNSNPTKAHERCHGKNNYHFVKGKLYKCAISGILPEFVKQFPFNISKEDMELVNSYVPLSMNNINTIGEFVKSLPNEISQCKFCPDGLGASFKLNAVSGNKIKVKKL